MIKTILTSLFFAFILTVQAAPTWSLKWANVPWTITEPWTPALIATEAWYDASDTNTLGFGVGSNVSQWDDKSGNYNHAVQGTGSFQPTSGGDIGGLNAIQFNGDYFNFTDNITTLRAAIWVSEKTSRGLDSANVAGILGTGNTTGDHTFIRGTGADDYDISIDGTVGNTGKASVNGNLTPTSGNNIDLGLTLTERTTAELLWYTEYDQAQSYAYLAGMTGTASQNYALVGDIGEMILLSSVPSESDRQKLEGYLAWKWGLEANLPAGHPYKSSAPTYTFEIPRQLPSATATMDSVNLVNDYWMSTHVVPQDNEWASAAYFSGAMELLEYEGSATVDTYIELWGDNYSWTKPVHQPGNFYFADDQCCGQTYIDYYIYEGSSDPSKTNSIAANLTAQVALLPTSNYWDWCDALYMAPATFVKLGVLRSDTNYFDAMHDFWTYTRSNDSGQGLYDETRHLWFRDSNYFYPAVQAPNGEPVFWSRGNGWVFAGLARVLTDLPAGATDRAEYEAVFVEMAEKLVTIQKDDGSWGSSLLDIDDYACYETSGTAFFTFGLAWGVNNELLDRSTYEQYIAKAWNGMVLRAVRSNGALGYIQAVGGSPSISGYSSQGPYAVGAFIQAGIEISKMQE